MRIVQIIGGLGNQMWQYALLVALKKRFPEEDVYYNASFFNGYSLHNGFELDRIFNITARQASVKDIRKVYHHFIGHNFFMRLYTHYFPEMKTERREVESSPYRKEVLQEKGDFYYNGYWADHRYFDTVRHQLLKEFSLKEPLDKKNQEFLNEMSGKETCSLHVRRGDYLKDPDYRGICDLDYYQKAISIVIEKTDKPICFLIFSNDMNWCKEKLVENFGSNEVVYVDWNRGCDSYKDMYLMSQCQANIIANSSFSWWGAYLNESPNKLVVSPLRYKNKDMGFKIPLDDWICI
jgi:hypothetical protein